MLGRDLRRLLVIRLMITLNRITVDRSLEVAGSDRIFLLTPLQRITKIVKDRRRNIRWRCNKHKFILRAVKKQRRLDKLLLGSHLRLIGKSQRLKLIGRDDTLARWLMREILWIGTDDIKHLTGAVDRRLHRRYLNRINTQRNGSRSLILHIGLNKRCELLGWYLDLVKFACKRRQQRHDLTVSFDYRQSGIGFFPLKIFIS